MMNKMRIKKGDTVVEVHVNNKEMKDVSVRMVLKVFNAEFLAMAKALRDDPEYADIKGFFGRTVLYPLNKKSISICGVHLNTNYHPVRQVPLFAYKEEKKGSSASQSMHGTTSAA